MITPSQEDSHTKPNRNPIPSRGEASIGSKSCVRRPPQQIRYLISDTCLLMITTRRQHLIKLCTTMQSRRASSSSSSRTRIRDPRKARERIVETSSAVVARREGENLPSHQSRNEVGPPLNNNYQQHPPSTLGMLGSYVMAGVGVALGVTLVSALFGAIG
jgi:hypothetical protein